MAWSSGRGNERWMNEGVEADVQDVSPDEGERRDFLDEPGRVGEVL